MKQRRQGQIINIKRAIIAIIIFLLGLGSLLYPTISNLIFERNGSRARVAYEEQMAALDEETRNREWERAERYNRALTGQSVDGLFLDGSGMALPNDYESTLNIGGVMGYVEIPKIGVHLPIYHGTSDEVLEIGIGHIEGTTLPIGGETRHCVITGHTGRVQAKLFTDLNEMRVGDVFFIHVLGEVLAYKVDQLKIIEPEIIDDLRCFKGKDYFTLMTCTPYGINSHRLLVRGERTDYDPDAADQIEKVRFSLADIMLIKAAVITSIIVLIVFFIVLFFQRRKRKDEEEEEEEGGPL